MPSRNGAKIFLRAARRLDQRLHRLFSGRSDLHANPLFGDRCIEYAFVICQVASLNRGMSVLDVGCCGSPLTTAIKGMGFQTVHGIDLLPSPVEFPGVDFFSDDFLTTSKLDKSYDVVVFCSSLEHFGLDGRYGSHAGNDADFQALRRGIALLQREGILILTVPYGVERTVAPWHRVYNKGGDLLKYALMNLELETEVFFARETSKPWATCSEANARRVVPTADSYALGMFTFRSCRNFAEKS